MVNTRNKIINKIKTKNVCSIVASDLGYSPLIF